MTVFPTITEVKAIEKGRIWVGFSDGRSGEVDLSHLLQLKPFEKWHDPGFFEGVFIADGGRCVAWNEELEVCPNTLYLNLIGKEYEEYAAH